jgi:hypothetical protein
MRRPSIAPINAATREQRTLNNANHQYSDRDARPENTAYFEKAIEIAALSPTPRCAVVIPISCRKSLRFRVGRLGRHIRIVD